MVRLLLYGLSSVSDLFSLVCALILQSHFTSSLSPSLPHFFLSVSHTLSVGYSLGGDAYWATGLHVFAPLPFTSGEFFGRIRMHAFTTAGNLIPLSELVLLREQLIIIGHRKSDVQHKPCYIFAA